MKLVFSKSAYADLYRIRAFIRNQNDLAARRAASRIKDFVRLLLKYPQAGYVIDEGCELREILIPFGRGNFVVRYTIKGSEIVLLHIWHSRENRF